jgi:hypothetical protein
MRDRLYVALLVPVLVLPLVVIAAGGDLELLRQELRSLANGPLVITVYAQVVSPTVTVTTTPTGTVTMTPSGGVFRVTVAVAPAPAPILTAGHDFRVDHSGARHCPVGTEPPHDGRSTWDVVADGTAQAVRRLAAAALTLYAVAGWLLLLPPVRLPPSVPLAGYRQACGDSVFIDRPPRRNVLFVPLAEVPPDAIGRCGVARTFYHHRGIDWDQWCARSRRTSPPAVPLQGQRSPWLMRELLLDGNGPCCARRVRSPYCYKRAPPVKSEILELYVNVVDWGAGARGSAPPPATFGRPPPAGRGGISLASLQSCRAPIVSARRCGRGRRVGRGAARWMLAAGTGHEQRRGPANCSYERDRGRFSR